MYQPVGRHSIKSSFTCWHQSEDVNINCAIFCLQAEIQTEKQRILLLDTSKSPVESIRASGRYDFIVEHDVKELGAHTLVNLGDIS